MTSPGQFDHLRHAALDMLEAGNGMAAVSQLLAVPVAEIVRWRDEPMPPRPARPQPGAERPSAQPSGKVLRFPTTLVVRRGFPRAWMRQVAIGYGLAALAVGLLAWSLHHPGSLAEMLEVDLTAIIVCVYWWVQHSQPLFTLTADAIVVPALPRKTTMPYADLADWWLVMHVRNEGRDEEVEGRLLTLHSRGARARPIEVFVNDHVEIEPAVLERLDIVKTANQGQRPLTRLGR